MRNQPSEELSAKVKRDQEVMAQKARESLATGKARADDASKQVEQKYEGKRKAVDDKVGATRGTVEQTLHDAESRARGLSSDAKLRYDSYRDSAGDALSKTRSSVGKMYDDTKSATEQKISSVCSEVGKQEDNVRQGWFSWLRWSKSEAEKGERRLEDAKKTAASEVARAAEDVRQRAEKHT
ncbi:hypothetical protein AX15_001321 [Amanita polypyramis BW_CC]|nr:hypothetical protein AX15_001321 [Amanita polypyramis BW_CC]